MIIAVVVGDIYVELGRKPSSRFVVTGTPTHVKAGRQTDNVQDLSSASSFGWWLRVISLHGVCDL